MTKFKINSVIPGFKRLIGMTAEIYNKNGEILDSVDLNNKRKRFSLTFDKQDAFQGSQKSKFSIKLIDNNGDNPNFSGKSKQFDLDADEQTFTTFFRANKKRVRASLRPEVTLIEPELPVVPPVEPPVQQTGTTIELSSGSDVYSDTSGGRLIGATFVENKNLFTALDDVINAPAGTLGFGDELRDPSSNDTDLLNITSSGNNNLDNALFNVTRVSGIENLEISAINDNSVEADLRQFEGLKSVSASGSFTNQVIYQSYLTSGARNFDFSAVNTGGVRFANDNAGVNTNDAITLTGSEADDVLEANNGAAQINGGAGDDIIVGSTLVGSTITGGSDLDPLGFDTIRLRATNSVDKVDIINWVNGFDHITGFTGAKANPNAADLLRFDALTFNTYTAGLRVNQVNAAGANSSQTSNLFIVDTLENIRTVNTQTGQGTLAMATGRGEGSVYFSSNGNFAEITTSIAQIDNAPDFLASANVEIV